MTTLAALRQLVRQQTETTSAELPDVTIDNYLTQAFERTVNAEIQWPSHENSWTLTQAVGESSITIPADVNVPGIMSLIDNTYGVRLELLDAEEAEDRFWGTVIATSPRPYHYSIWNDTITLWPQCSFDEEREYSLRGFRLPTVFPVVGGDTAQEPDCDPRLHAALSHYATALAYAQQEDMELENQYMRRWQQDVDLARQNIMEPVNQRPLKMGPSVAHITPIGSRGRTRGSRNWSISAP